MKKSKLKPIPKFKSEDEERDFWATHDLTDFMDNFKPVELDLSELKPSTESISLRLPSFLLARIKELANKKRRSISVFNENIFKRESKPGIKEVIN